MGMVLGEAHQIFNNTVEDYDNYVVPKRIRQYKILMEMLEIGDYDDVVDLGCGTGVLTCMIAEKTRGFVVGLDFSENMIRKAKSRADKLNLNNTRFIHARIEEASKHLNEGSFDIVVSSHVIHWLKEPETIFRLSHRILSNNNGRIGLIISSEDIYAEIREAIATICKRYCPLSSYDIDELIMRLLGRKNYKLADVKKLVNKTDSKSKK